MLTPRNRRQLALLSCFLLVLAGTITTVVVGRQTGPAAVSSSPSPARAAEGSNPAGGLNRADAVKLQSLANPRPTFVEGGRNPFRFATPTATSQLSDPALSGGRSGDAVTSPSGVTYPSPIETAAPTGPPPIPLRFIGFVDAVTQGGKIAVLTNGRSVFHGRENEVIDGRFRIVRIGAESMDLMFVDGRGVQTIKLSGQ